MMKVLIKRNVKLFFKDKGLFFTSLITPLILLVLYATFLKQVYTDSFVSNLPEGVIIKDSLINGLVGGQLISSILAVSCVTVSFCSNFLMVQDKSNKVINDLMITPVKRSTLVISYYISTLISTFIICFFAAFICLGYIMITGWYLSFLDVILLFIDIILLVLFGTALSSIINCFLSTQGQISAVGSIVSSCYGFICGAYMPISSFGKGLQKIISFLPGTYGTSLVRNHSLNGVFEQMEKEGIPSLVIDEFRNITDCNVYFFDNRVEVGVMYLILGVTVTILVSTYILINKYKKVRK